MRTKFSNNSFISLVSYKSLNHGALRAMLVMLLFVLGIGNAWGGTAYTRGRAFLKEGCPTGSGKVYVGGGGKSSTPGTYTQLNSYDTPVTDEKAEAQATRTYYFYAQANSGYKFTGWYKKNTDDTYTLVTTETSCSGSVTSGKDPSSGSSYKDIDRYAEFIKIVHYSFIVPEHGSYTITNNGVEVENYATIEAEGVVHLVSLPAEGYRFAGWYTTTDGGVTKNYFSFDPETDLSFSDDATVGVDFRLDNGNALFYVVNGGMHDNLTTAITEASSISPKVITVAQDGHLASGNYTIPSGVTLLVQHNKSYDVQTKPELVISASSLFVYRRLTMLEGANITCNGTICIAGKQVCLGGGKASGYITGGCGVIDMSAGGHIELNNGANLYAWGFITGQDVNQGNNTSGVGTIVANSGSKVWEDFAVGDWRGGTACLDIQGTNFFPFQSYFIQNIEVPLTIKYGAVDNCYASVSGDGKYLQLSATMIGTTDALFKLASGGVVRKWYDATTDLMCFELSGTANLDAVVVKGLPAIGTISSADYYLPISSNMHIILTNSNVTISKPMTVQPGAKIEVKSDANITISSNVFLYDKEEWGPYAGPDYYFHNYGAGILTAHKNRGNGKSKELLDDAQIIVDGQLNITGKLYSTASGADVMGNGGGHAIFSALPSSSTTIAAFTGNGDAVSGGVTVNTANLHNEDESYTKAIASTTFSNVHGRWFKLDNQNENADDHTYNFTYIASGAVSGTGGTDVSPNTHNAVYALDKTGLTAGMKWCNVTQDGTCPAIYNATQDLNGTAAANIRYTYQSSDWLQLLKTETEGVYGGSDNNLYALDGCAVNSLGSVDENCLYTIDGVKKALVDGHFVALAKNDDDEAFHNTADAEDYYISFEGCTWHPATKYAGEEKAYIVEDDIYIWYNNDWLLVEREDPYFFDYNDQNVKRYYEYENGAWVLATPCVSVTDVLETRYFYFWPEAFAIANSKKNATITLLKNVSSATSPLSFTAKNTTCTLDLNGHTASLSITASGNSANLFAINAANSTFTITDNSANKDGVLDITTSLKVTSASYHTRGIAIVDGALILDAGTVRLSNTYPYTKTSNSGMIKGINVAAGKSFTMNGGAVYAESPYYPRAINVEGSTSANATVTLNSGTITANATAQTNAMGIYTLGGTTTIKDGVTINATTKTTTAYGIYVDASTSNYWGTVNMTGGTVNATASTKTAHGIYVNCAMVSNKTTPNTFGATYSAVANISGGTFNVSTLSAESATGVTSRGTTTISGGTFYVTPKTTSAYGVSVQHGTTTINGNPVFDVKATTSATGILVATAPADKTGQPMNGNVIVNGGTFDVETTTGDAAYGVYINAAQRVITSTDSGYYPGTYYSVGTATINGGTFNVTAKTYNVYGVYVQRLPIYEAGTNHATVHRGSATITGGTFTVRDLTHKTTTGACDGVRSYGTLTITGGIFDVAASAATAKNATYVYGVNVFDGTASISGTPEFTVSAYGTAFGAVANGATPDKATGLPCEADLTIDGGTFNVNTTTSTTAYGVYAAGPAPRVITSTAAGYYPGTYYSKPVATVNDGTFNVKAKTTTAIGAYCGRGVLYDQEVLEPHTVELESFGELNIKGGTFNVSTLGTTTADGVRSFGTTNITGGTFNVTPKTTTATAIRTYAGKTTITDNPHFTVKGTTTVYGLNAGCEAPNAKSGLTYNGEIECNGGTFDLETTTGATCYGVYAYAGSVKITTLHSADANYFAGNYASAGTIVVNDGIFNVKAKTTGAYGVVVPAAVSQSGATGYPTATATAKCDINGGKFLVNGTEKYAVYKKATTANFKISGGYWGGDGVNNNLAYYAVSPNKVLTLREVHALYADGYRYTIGEGGTVIWKNGETTLLSEDYLKGETPEYTGETPTKEATAEYTYEHNGWDPTVEAMANADQTYTATYSSTPRSYTLTWVTDGDELTGAYTNGLVPYGTTIVAPNTPTKTGSTFAGWSDGSSVVTPATTMPAANTTYTATWESAETGFWLDIIDVDNTNHKLVVNANNSVDWPAASWPFSINDVAYYANTTAGSPARDAKNRLEINYGSLEPGAEFSITVKNTGNEVVSKHTYVIPQEVTSATELSANAARPIFVKGTTLTINGSITTKNIYVGTDAKLVINEGKTLTADTIFLRTTPEGAAELINQGTISASTQLCYTRIIMVKGQYYQFGLPLSCPISNVFLSDNATLKYTTGWLLRAYSESKRAAQGAEGKNWETLKAAATIEGGKGYEMYSGSNYYREFYFPVNHAALANNKELTVTRTKGGAAGEKHAGWNVLVSPLTYTCNNDAQPEDMAICLMTSSGWEDQTVLEHIAPAQPFAYQAEEAGTISFVSATMPSLAPRRRIAAADESTRIQWIRLDVKDAKGEGDETNIYSHPTRYEQYYQTGIDVAKQSLTAARARLYSSHAYGDMAFAGVSDELFEQGVALTVYSPAAQELTFSLRQNEWLNRLQYVWIIDAETGAMIDLLSSDYTAEVTEGTTYGRFYISGRFRTPQIATDIDEAQGDEVRSTKAQKVLIEEKIYIMVGDKLYDATGKLVKGK